MLFILCLESKTPETEENVFKKLRQKEEVLKELGWEDVIFKAFDFKRYVKDGAQKVIKMLEMNLISIPHYKSVKKFKRVLIIFDNDINEINEKFLLIENQLKISLNRFFTEVEDNIHHVKIPLNNSFEYFLCLFCKDGKKDFSKKEWENRKKATSKFSEKLWTEERLEHFKTNVKKYENSTSWRLLFKNEK